MVSFLERFGHMRKKSSISDTPKAFLLNSTSHPPKAEDPLRVRLVEDLVPTIIDFGGDIWTRHDLTQFSRVSPAWLFAIRKRLYTSVKLDSLKQLDLLARTLQSTPRLSAHVKRIAIEEPPTMEVEHKSQKEITRSFHGLFQHASHVQGISVSGSIGVAHLDEALASLRKPEALMEIEVTGPPGITSSRMPRMADRILWWTVQTPIKSLKSLRLTRVKLHLALPPNCRGLPPNLTHLYLEDAEISNLVSLVLYPQLTSLTIVAHGSPPNIAHLMHPRHIIPRVSNSLEHLFISIDAVDTLFDNTDWQFPPCPQLKTIQTDGVFYPRLSFDKLEEACPQLEEWTVFGKDLRYFFRSWTDWVSAGRSPTLKKMQVSQGQTRNFRLHPWSKEAEDELKEVAAIRGIELSFGLPRRGFSMA